MVSEDMFEECGRRTPTEEESTYTISSPMNQGKGSGELIRTEITILRFHQEMKIVSFNVNE